MFTAGEVRLMVSRAYKHGQRQNKSAFRKLFEMTFTKATRVRERASAEHDLEQLKIDFEALAAN